jgi:hypothetical protein
MRRVGQIGVAYVFLRDRREINIRAEGLFDSPDVRRVAVRRDLRSIENPRAQIVRQLLGVRSIALADHVGDHGEVALCVAEIATCNQTSPNSDGSP